MLSVEHWQANGLAGIPADLIAQIQEDARHQGRLDVCEDVDDLLSELSRLEAVIKRKNIAMLVLARRKGLAIAAQVPNPDTIAQTRLASNPTSFEPLHQEDK